ncbi:GroES-like protein [Hypoxylon sp. FL1150]|nr:GroES-like protein [Hypoxylon sp. FL1150]
MPKQVLVQGSIEAVEFIETPIPMPDEKQVVIKVVVSGANPKDWKYPYWKDLPSNSGDDIAGIVHSVGKDVYEFKPGDRVAALHQPLTDNGSFAEYAVAPDWTTFHLPQNVSFEEAATIPVAALTAANALYGDLKLPTPFDPVNPTQDGTKIPIVIYGVSSAVGAFAAKFARLSGLSPIIGVAGRAGDFAKNIVDHVVDYRKGEDALVAAIEEILVKEGLGPTTPYVFDAISENGSLEATLRFVDLNGGSISTVLPPKLFAKDKGNFEYPSGVKAFNSALPLIHVTRKDFGYVWSRYLSRLLEDGRLKPHPYEVIPGGLKGVLTGLQKLKDGKASAVKYVFRIEETGDVALGLTGPVSTRTQPHPLRNFPYSD